MISFDSSDSSIISVIYNSYCFCHQCLLWHELAKISSLHLPWLIVGDFNSILSRNEHKEGSFAYYDKKARFLLNFIDENNLFDLKFYCSPYTWCNNQHGATHWWARIDWCLVNMEWNSAFESYALKHLSCTLFFIILFFFFLFFFCQCLFHSKPSYFSFWELLCESFGLSFSNQRCLELLLVWEPIKLFCTWFLAPILKLTVCILMVLTL